MLKQNSDSYKRDGCEQVCRGTANMSRNIKSHLQDMRSQPRQRIVKHDPSTNGNSWSMFQGEGVACIIQSKESCIAKIIDSMCAWTVHIKPFAGHENTIQTRNCQTRSKYKWRYTICGFLYQGCYMEYWNSVSISTSL